jgi:uroporphyrinogen-III synthase
MLEGKTIAITRSKDDSSEFIDLATKDNVRPISLPTIELVSKGEKIVDEFLDSVKQYDPDYSVFMSSKAVTLLFDTAKKISKFEKLQLAVANTIVMAVGPKTKIALENEGIKVACMPNTYSSVGVGELFTKLHAVGKKVCAFRDTSQWNEFRELFSQNKVDGIVFTSASSVRAFFEIMSKDYDENSLLSNLEKLPVVAIGPFTSDELKKFNIKNTIAQVHTVLGAFDTIKSIFSAA